MSENLLIYTVSVNPLRSVPDKLHATSVHSNQALAAEVSY